MIRQVLFNATDIQAGDTLEVNIDAAYPVVIEIYCFVTQPPPAKFVPCPSAGSHRLDVEQPFYFVTSSRTFQNDGGLEVNITDAEGDRQSYQINVSGLNTPLATY